MARFAPDLGLFMAAPNRRTHGADEHAPARTARSTTRQGGLDHPVLMCPPTFFTVAYEINPWMSADRPVDTDPGLRTVAASGGDLRRPRCRGGADRARARPARHGLRRERGRGRRRPGPRGQVPPPAAPGRGRRLRPLVRSTGTARRRSGPPPQRGPGRRARGSARCCWPATAPAPAGRPTGRSRRGADGRSSRCVSSTLATTTSTPPCSRSVTPSPTGRRPSTADRGAELERRFPDALIADAADAAVLGLNAVVVGRDRRALGRHPTHGARTAGPWPPAGRGRPQRVAARPGAASSAAPSSSTGSRPDDRHGPARPHPLLRAAHGAQLRPAAGDPRRG